MRRDLALQLLQTTLPDMDEGSTSQLFRDLELLANYKYNAYEMYYPGRLFLENLYLWLRKFEDHDRQSALDFIRTQLIFVSREEFQQLAQILYNDRIRRRQLEIAGQEANLPKHRVHRIRTSDAFGRITRSSLYVGMSDGARLDYIRRHNLDLNNEQVIPYYAVNAEKVDDCLLSLRGEIRDQDASFQCLLLIDDFAGSGNTLLREVVTVPLKRPMDFDLPPRWKARLRLRAEPPQLEFLYHGILAEAELNDLLSLDNDEDYLAAINALQAKCAARDTSLKGSLVKVASGPIAKALADNASIYFCPLLTTTHAVDRLQELMPRLPGPFAQTKILTAALLDSRVTITNVSQPIGALCEKYYDEDLADEHTGNVMFGYEGCGLPLVLHHNTPNNSLHLIWHRRNPRLDPLFVRYERHGREAI